MSTKVYKIKGPAGEVFYPFTSVNAVYTDDAKSIGEVLPDLTALAEEAKANSDEALLQLLDTMKYQGEKLNFVEINMLTDMVKGDVWKANDFEILYVYTGTEWTALSPTPDLTVYALKDDTYTKTEVDAKVSSVYKYKGVKADYSEIEAITDMIVGDVWEATDTGSNYAWNGTVWDNLGAVADLSAYALKTEIPVNVSELTNDADYVPSSTVYSKAESDMNMYGSVKLKGAVQYFEDLPATPALGELWSVADEGENYMWNGGLWEKQAKPLERATSSKLGGVKAIDKTTEDVQLAIDADGVAWYQGGYASQFIKGTARIWSEDVDGVVTLYIETED